MIVSQQRVLLIVINIDKLMGVHATLTSSKDFAYTAKFNYIHGSGAQIKATWRQSALTEKDLLRYLEVNLIQIFNLYKLDGTRTISITAFLYHGMIIIHLKQTQQCNPEAASQLL